jgi:hypothetical protein
MKRRSIWLLAPVPAAAAFISIWWMLPPAAIVLQHVPFDGPVVRGSIHIHTARSDGSGSIDDVASAARRAGLQFVVITDHGDGTRKPEPPAYRESVLCIDGVEISTTGGHYLALGMPQTPYRLAGEPRDVVEDVKRFGGFGIVAHPDSPKPALAWTDWDVPVDGVEWLNADTEWRRRDSNEMARAFATYLVRPAETLAALFGAPGAVFSRWDAMTRSAHVIAVGGNDAHARLGTVEDTDTIVGGMAAHLPSYEAAFRSLSVSAVLGRSLTGKATDDAATVLDAIRRGHVFTTIDGAATPGALMFEATSAGAKAAAGDDLAVAGAADIRARVPDVPGVSLVLIKDGAVVQRAGSTLAAHHDARSPRAVYRVEAWLSGRSSEPWIVSNPISVGPRAPAVPPLPEPPSQEVMPVPIDRRERWRVEHDPKSVITLAPARLPWGGNGLLADVRLAAGGRHSQYAAAVAGVEKGSLTTWTRIRLTAASSVPMRASLQVRTPPGGERWVRSVYLDTRPRDIVVPFDEMMSVELGTRGRIPLTGVDSLLLVADTTNTVPGATIRVWISRLQIERAVGWPEPTQVRTVKSK